MCRGAIFNYLLCLISNTIPQLEQSSLHPSTVLHHRLLLQTTCYNHLRLLLHLLLPSKGKKKQQQARNTPLSRGVEKPEGPSALQHTTEISLAVEIDRSIHGFLQMISNQYLPSYAIIFQLIQDHVHIISL